MGRIRTTLWGKTPGHMFRQYVEDVTGSVATLDRHWLCDSAIRWAEMGDWSGRTSGEVCTSCLASVIASTVGKVGSLYDMVAGELRRPHDREVCALKMAVWGWGTPTTASVVMGGRGGIRPRAFILSSSDVESLLTESFRNSDWVQGVRVDQVLPFRMDGTLDVDGGKVGFSLSAFSVPTGAGVAITLDRQVMVGNQAVLLGHDASAVVPGLALIEPQAASKFDSSADVERSMVRSVLGQVLEQYGSVLHSELFTEPEDIIAPSSLAEAEERGLHEIPIKDLSSVDISGEK